MLLQIKTADKTITNPQDIKETLIQTIGARFVNPRNRNKLIPVKEEYLRPLGDDTLKNAGDIPSDDEIDEAFRQMANRKTPQEDMITKELIDVGPKSIKISCVNGYSMYFVKDLLLKRNAKQTY